MQVSGLAWHPLLVWNPRELRLLLALAVVILAMLYVCSLAVVRTTPC